MGVSPRSNEGRCFWISQCVAKLTFSDVAYSSHTCIQYNRPTYRALYKIDKDLARQTFQKHRGFYHPIAASMIEKVSLTVESRISYGARARLTQHAGPFPSALLAGLGSVGALKGSRGKRESAMRTLSDEEPPLILIFNAIFAHALRLSASRSRTLTSDQSRKVSHQSSQC